MNAAAEVIYDLVDPGANLIFGAVIDQSLSGQVSWNFLMKSGSSVLQRTSNANLMLLKSLFMCQFYQQCERDLAIIFPLMSYHMNFCILLSSNQIQWKNSNLKNLLRYLIFVSINYNGLDQIRTNTNLASLWCFLFRLA